MCDMQGQNNGKSCKDVNRYEENAADEKSCVDRCVRADQSKQVWLTDEQHLADP